MKTFHTLLFIAFNFSVYSQSITHGPIVGAVSDVSCRVLIRTDSSAAVTVELSTSNTFSTIDASAIVTTDAAKDTFGIADINGLQADTKYYVRAVISGAPSGFPSYFMTFPAWGTTPHQVFVTGSCLYDLTNADSGLFVRATQYHPKAFIQCGDWGYPDAATGTTDIYGTNPPTSFAVNISKHYNFYKLRYQSPSSVGFMKSLCTDYVYDDHDFLNDNCAKDAVSAFKLGLPLGGPVAIAMPPQARLNSIKAYQQCFPGYPLVDSTEGIYHSFRSGNTEFFVLDLRAMRTPQVTAVSQVGSQWVYNAPPGFTILGAKQTAWLRNGLNNSTATWKFIISSDAFNIGLRMTVDSCLKVGNGSVPYWGAGIPGIPNYGYIAFQNYADCWAGFKEDADSMVKFVMNNNIKNVFMISGDTHTVGIDDGTNSGIPELNSGNLKKANSEEWVTNQQFMGFNIWNKGGSGLCYQNNFENSFGKIETFGDDSVRLSAVTESGTEVAGWTFMKNEPYKYNPLYHPNRLPLAANDMANATMNDSAIISVTSNDYDMENDPLFVNLRTTPANGTAVVNANNTVTYIPNANYTGVDTFRYLVCDHTNPGCENCAAALVTINVGPSSLIETSSGNVQIYPNPAHARVFIRSSSLQTLEVELLNLAGAKLLSRQITGSGSFDTSQFASGNYMLSVTNSKTHEVNKIKLSLMK